MSDAVSHKKYPHLGLGLGLRTPHYEAILNHPPKIDWFEILSENYMVAGGKPLYYLDKIRAHYPVVMHGVSLSIGSVDPVDRTYLKQLKNLAERVEPAWVSDHLCWTGLSGTNSHDLLPLPYTEDALRLVVQKIHQVQDVLERRILLENVSSYVTFRHSEMTEWAFLRAVAEEADCLILLDINNIYVSGYNHGFDPLTYLKEIPAARVQQLHMAGHSHHGTHIIDTHDAAIIDPVWALYAEALRLFGPLSAMIERDDRIPPLDELLAEWDTLRHITDRVLREAA